MLRSALLLCVVITACNGPDQDDPATDDAKTDTDTPIVDTATTDSGTFVPTDPWAEIVAPPTDVTADCWSWSVGESSEPWWVSLNIYDPGTLSLTYTENDYDPDGNPDYIGSYTWDAAFDNVLRYDYDYDADGIPDRVVEQIYDNGLRTEYREDADGDGVLDRVWTYTYNLDLLVLAEADDDADGLVDTWWHYQRDGQDRLIAIEGDDGDDGSIDHVWTYVFDDTAPGVAYTRAYDDEVDGLPEETWSYVYDTLEQQTHYGFTDHVTEDAWTYDYTHTADGDVETRSVVTTIGGVWNDATVTTYAYEAPGRVATAHSEADLTGDGQPNLTYVETTTWFCP